LHELDDLCLNYYGNPFIKESQNTLTIDQSIVEIDYAGNNLANTDDSITKSTEEEHLLTVKSSIINILYKPVRNVHARLSEFAKKESIQLKDLHTTLIFALVKKFEFGYVVLSFGVGDCPINIVLDDLDEVHLLNILDIGEFGGGTRFITMPEIFTQPEMPGRFSLNKFDNFSKLVLMTDGIYDAKFITENKLRDKQAWKAFLQDLDGENEDGTKVDFADDEHVDDQLLSWLDFWSKGNHDDRTLAIIY
ncbi:protein phosphatase 2C domain-containing protein, partial [Brucella sp. 21LCYQ03]|nr:protein phosphatase 2C domain-containing protein [Brucella sp. 21LCYQ03]